MVLIELIGSLSLATSLISIALLVIIHTKQKQDDLIATLDRPAHYFHHRQLQLDRSASVLPFEEFDRSVLVQSKDLPIVHVIQQNEISSSPRKYGIEWIGPPSIETKQSSSHLLKIVEFDQGDSLSFSDPITTSVKDLIEKFEKKNSKSAGKIISQDVLRDERENSRRNQTDSDLTSIDTNLDSQTTKIDLNQNQQKRSHYSSTSHLDITIPSGVSSSLDLGKFECFSTTSNLSDFLNH